MFLIITGLHFRPPDTTHRDRPVTRERPGDALGRGPERDQEMRWAGDPRETRKSNWDNTLHAFQRTGLMMYHKFDDVYDTSSTLDDNDEWVAGVMSGRVLEVREPAKAEEDAHFLTVYVYIYK
ncbi:hypothetical protein B5X24_HaOG204418 [Helicoverpa armigera]|uniref:Uncharacterized protein n=1 Tax=Helicoverpa armigera TaxID=29058 RepID=A0A2W1BNP7_HELAM|nr:hypothetical protein B5X24_HaOG204418 [Helicoverpa armigera]